MNIYNFFNNPEKLNQWHKDDPNNVGKVIHTWKDQGIRCHKIYPDGTEFWYLNGKRHREDGPPVIYPNGTEFWYKDDMYHRVIMYPYGTQSWNLNDE